MNVVCEDIGNLNVKIIEEFHFLFTPFSRRDAFGKGWGCNFVL